MSGVRTWLRGNRWTLIALVVLAAASVWWSLRWDWQEYQDNTPTKVIDVARGDVAAYDGGTFSLYDLVVLEGDTERGRQYGVLEGTDVVVADIEITPRPGGDPDDFVSCDIDLLAPSPQGQREWRPEVSDPTTYGPGYSGATGCNISGGPSYILRQYYVIPAGGADVDPTLQVTILEAIPLTLHLH
jgi:hypothetical protein